MHSYIRLGANDWWELGLSKEQSSSYRYLCRRIRSGGSNVSKRESDIWKDHCIEDEKGSKEFSMQISHAQVAECHTVWRIFSSLV